MRFVPGVPVAIVLCLVISSLSHADVKPALPSFQRAMKAEVVVAGKVASIEKDLVELRGANGELEREFRIALVKVETALKGANGLTHIKVGFTPPAPPAVANRPSTRRVDWAARELKEGQELLLFLTPHPRAGFYVMEFQTPPIDLANDEGKKSMDQVKKALAVIADPKAALTAAKAEDRYHATCIMLMHYRQYPRGTGKHQQEPIDADENRLILKGLLDGDWSAAANDTPGGTTAIGLLGLGAKDGFNFTKVPPGQKPATAFQQAYEKWLKGPGQNYVIKRYTSVK